MTETSSPRARRKSVEQWEVEVTATQRIADNLQRLTLTSPRFKDYDLAGPDEYFGLLVPRQDPAERPALRWYSMRYFRPHEATVDVDIVLHGDQAPGTAFATHARPGDVVNFRRGGSEYALPPVDGHHLLVGDETSAPALASILDHARATSCGKLTAVLEVPDQTYVDPNALSHDITLLCRGGDKPGTLSIPHVESLSTDGWTGAWLCGESRMSTTLRRHAVGRCGIDRKSVVFSGYWRFS